MIKKLVGKKITDKDLKKFKKIEEDFNFHIYRRANKDGGGFIADIGTEYPTSDPADCSSYWTRQRKDGSYECEKYRGGEHGEMVWVIGDDGRVRIASILNDDHIVISYPVNIFNRLNNVRGKKFYDKVNFKTG